MKVKTSELTGSALDWAVSVAESYDYAVYAGYVVSDRGKQL